MIDTYHVLDADVIIIGAGISGLVAAYALLQKEPTLNLLILEATDRIGGRVISKPLIDKNNDYHMYDIGGHWINPQQKEIIELLAELNVNIEFSSNHFGKIIFDYDGKIFKESKPNAFAFLTVGAKLELARFVTKIENLCKKVRLDPDLAATSMEKFISLNIKHECVKALIEWIILKNFGLKTADLTLGFYVFFCTSSHGIANQLDGLNEFWIKDGATWICNKIMFLANLEPIIKARVGQIKTTRRHSEVTTTRGTFYFNLDPTVRDSFWTFFFGYTIQWTNYVSLSQAGVQKFLALPTFREWVCHFSAITIMAAPSDIYKFGAYYIYTTIGMALLGLLAIFVFFPVFFKLQVTSIYEYLEKRFDHKTKIFVSFLFILGEVFTIAVSTFAPSLALAAVYAHYAKCDPFITGKIQRHEQLLPYYTAEIAGLIPGVVGFTLVGLFCATMSHFSAITIMIVPVEIYKFGGFYLYVLFAVDLMSLITIYIFLPVFFNLQITSVYEYLEKRFDSRTRLLISLFFVISEILTLSICLYIPALAISVVSGFHVHLITVTISAICIFYTTIGGLKTVVWTDFLQVGIILLSLIIVLILGFISSGNVWNKALETGRLDIFDLDPTKRDTFWTFVVGYTIHWTNYVSLTQSGVQKYLTLPTLKDCNNAVKIFALVMNVVVILCILLGFLIYAHYSNCDPLLSGKIKKHEQLVPYYIMEIAGNLPGVFSLTLVAFFCASLSTISSSLNAISGVIYKDFVTKFVKSEITEKTAGYILRIIVVIAGILFVLIVFVIEHLGDIFPLVMSMTAFVDGPSVALFTSGVLIPKMNAKGAFIGAIVAFIIQGVIFIISKIYLYNKAIVAIPKPKMGVLIRQFCQTFF
ncbi:hypothetical protein TcasGA2_TC031445 [Tribolium castaneum]|uniref:Amine oxidase domain-containing protein n=1 Tax=Tribolium castaneum TaxID=7070 RepID=A0A139WAL7_TRICA|nr:hypothetical protein TcasGA2_TC031445 [Tribolium castaneum]